MHCNIRHISTRRSLTYALLGLAGWLNPGSLSAQITVPTDYKSYAIMGGSTVQLNAYSAVLGDVYSAGSTNLEFGYQVQRSNTSGSFYSRGSFSSTGSTSDIKGNIAANNDVSLTSGVEVTGNVQYGGILTVSGTSTIAGTRTQVSNSVPLLTLPTPRTFTAGTNNINATSNLVLAPGTYGDVIFSGSANTLTLSSGDYFVRSFNGDINLRTINLNLTNGPIRFYSEGNINMTYYIDVNVNGVPISYSSSTIQPEARLASAVLFQTNGNFVQSAGTISTFFGTVHAPNGSVELSTSNRYGTIIAGGAITAEGYQYKQSYNFNNEALGVLTQQGSTPQVIVGGSITVNSQLANLAATGGGTLNYSATPTGTTSGLSVTNVTHTGTLVPGANTGLAFNVTGTTAGTKTLTVGMTTPGAFDASSSAGLTVSVLDHASASFTTNTAARAMLGSTALGTAAIRNASGTRAGLQVTNPGSLLGVAANTVIAPGGSVTASGAINTSTLGSTTSSYTIQLSDNQTIAGATALPDLNVVVAGSILDNRRVTAQGTVDLGIVHSGVAISGNATLVTTGADNSYTRITVNNTTAADTNGISTTGSTAFRFGQDGLSSTRALSGTPNKNGSLSGTLTLTTNAEAGVTGGQSLANVTVPYTVKVFSGKSTWNGSVADSWSTHTNWTDNLSDAGVGSPGLNGVGGDTATFGNVIGNQAANIALNGASPALANIAFDNNLGGSYTLSTGTGGAISLSNTPMNPVISVANGNHRITAPLTLINSNIIAVNNPASTLTIDGSVTSVGAITKNGAGTLVFTAVTNSLGPITINAGTVRGSLANLNNTITNNGELILDQPTNATYTGTITGTGTFTKTGNGRITLTGIDQFNANAPLTISGGALIAPIGLPRSGAPINLQTGGTLETAFTVTRAISGTGSIVALDDLTLGRSSQPGQFNLGGAVGVGGSLNIGSHAAVLLSSDAVILGTLTSLQAQGSLTTLNGARLGNASSVDTTKVLSAAGNAVINGNFVNNGQVHGPTTVGQWLTFTQDVTGAGGTTGNILYAGSYSPGNSPAVVSVENIAFDSTSLLTMEIAGTDVGQFDQLLGSGMVTLDGTLDLQFLNGFVPSVGNAFDLFEGSLSGTFDRIILPSLNGGMIWNTSNLYTTGVLSVITTGPSSWQGVSGALWSATGSWTNGVVPSNSTNTALFANAAGAETPIVLDSNQTINALSFDSTSSYTISAAAAQVLSLAGTTPTISTTAATNTGIQTVAVALNLGDGTTINANGGTLVLNAPINSVLGPGVTANVGAGATLSLGGAGNALSDGTTHVNVTNDGTIAATTADKRVGNISGTGTTTVTAAGATLTANHVRQAGLTIGAGNKVTIAADGTNSGVSRVTNLSINATGQLDLNNNDLIVDNGNLAAVTLLLKTGLDITGAYGGGPGITSTTFATNPLTNTALGAAANSELGYVTFSGQAVDANDILVKYTYFGDADLNGVVDTATDFDLYITGLTSGGSLGGWLYGDFDYNGTVDSATDFDLYITGLTSQSGALLTAGSAPIQAVPEPGTLVLGGLALLGFAGAGLRRRRLVKQSA